jgi:hypothetical protein
LLLHDHQLESGPRNTHQGGDPSPSQGEVAAMQLLPSSSGLPMYIMTGASRASHLHQASSQLPTSASQLPAGASQYPQGLEAAASLLLPSPVVAVAEEPPSTLPLPMVRRAEQNKEPMQFKFAKKRETVIREYLVSANPELVRYKHKQSAAKSGVAQGSSAAGGAPGASAAPAELPQQSALPSVQQ